MKASITDCQIAGNPASKTPGLQATFIACMLAFKRDMSQA
jgi:hypothetical protein